MVYLTRGHGECTRSGNSNTSFLLLVLSVAVLVLVFERAVMEEPIFDHEKLDVYRFSIEYVAFSHTIASRLAVRNRHARDQWLRAAQSVRLNIAEGNGKHSLKDRSRFFDIARGSALECAAIHDILCVCDAIDEEANRAGKSQLRRIVAMLTKLVARNESVSETPSVYRTAFEHEHEHEHEHEKSQNKAMHTKPSIGRFDLRPSQLLGLGDRARSATD